MRKEPKLKTDAEISKQAVLDGEAFALALEKAESSLPLMSSLKELFSSEMEKAIFRGRILMPERMAKLYPIFREINIELSEIDAENLYWKQKHEEEQKSCQSQM